MRRIVATMLSNHLWSNHITEKIFISRLRLKNNKDRCLNNQNESNGCKVTDYRDFTVLKNCICGNRTQTVLFFADFSTNDTMNCIYSPSNKLNRTLVKYMSLCTLLKISTYINV